jgi:hypothetical protein
MAQSLISAKADNKLVTGAATLTAGNNLLNTTAGAASTDLYTAAFGFGAYKTLQVQLTCASALTTGVVQFEGSLDGVNFQSIQATEMAYAWTGLTYTSCNWTGGFAGANPQFRSFKMNVEGFRFIRLRLSTAASANITCQQTWSQTSYVYPAPNYGTNLSRSFVAGITVTTTLVAAAGVGLRTFYVRGVYTNGGGAASTMDLWIVDGTGQTSGPFIATWTAGSGSGEGGNDTPATPIPTTTNTVIQAYVNNISSNCYCTIWWFAAP